MPYSYAVTVASGSTDTVSVPFQYISKAHVHVKLDDVLVEDGDLVWNSSSQIHLPSMPTNGTVVRVYRDTPLGSLIVEHPAASILDYRDLNTSGLHFLYAIQELKDFAESLEELIEELSE